MNAPRRIPLATAAAALLLAACGGSESSTATTAPTLDPEPTATTAVPAPAAFPVTVEHALGATTIDAAPRRVVTVGVTEQDTVLALGVVPVGVTDWYGDQPYATWPWAQDELGDAQPEVLTTGDGFEYEKIAALEPDLIVGTNAGLDEESYQLLSAIAPTIAHPPDAPLYFSPWDDQARLIAAALGRTEEMEAIIADIDARFAEARAAHPEFVGVSAIFLQNAFYDGNAIAYQEGLSTEFLTDLGFTIPSELDEFATEGQAYVPMEQLSVLDTGDVLLWATESPNDRANLEAEPLYNALRAVQDGKLVFTDGVTAGAIYFTSPLSLPFVLDQIVPALAATLAGEGPATIDLAGDLTSGDGDGLDADAPDLGRVVALAEEFILADVLALGITPVASTATVDTAGFQGIEEFDTAGIEVLPQTTLSLEYLASLQPDTIVTLQFWIDEIGADVLEGMADVIAIPDGLYGAERIEMLGDLLGRPEQAAAVATQLEVAEQEARDRIGDGCTLSLATIYPGPSVAAFVDGPWDIPSAIQAAGCQIDPGPDAAEPDGNGRAWLSEEQLGMLDQELLVLMQTDTVDGESDALTAIEASPLWQTLPAVQADSVVVFDRLGYPGATGLIRFYDEFGALLD